MQMPKHAPKKAAKKNMIPQVQKPPQQSAVAGKKAELPKRSYGAKVSSGVKDSRSGGRFR